MERLEDLIVYLFQLIAPQPCFDEIFVKYNFFNGTAYMFTYIKFGHTVAQVHSVYIPALRTFLQDCIAVSEAWLEHLNVWKGKYACISYWMMYARDVAKFINYITLLHFA